MKHTQIKVYPKSWEKNLLANLKKEWYIYYTFNGKPIKIKGGINYIKDLPTRQDMVRNMVAEEYRNLKNGFNPITKEFENFKGAVNPNTPFIVALEKALQSVIIAEITRKSIESELKIVKASAKNIGITGKEISEIRKRDITLLLFDIVERGYSNDKYNRIRSYLSILFKYFVSLDIFEYNFINNIEKLPHTQTRRKIYTSDDIEKLGDIKAGNYHLWRFLNIFHASQSRISEMRNLKIENINISQQTFTITEKKGKRYRDVLKPINLHTSHLWKEAINEAKKSDIYLFGDDLTPSPEPCSREKFDALFKYWKKKTGLTKTAYALRHTFANHIANTYGIGEAQRALGHTSQKTTEIYAVDYRENLVKSQANLDVAIK